MNIIVYNFIKRFKRNILMPAIKERPAIRRRAAIPRPIMTEDVISFSECRNNLASCFKRAAETHRTIFVTQNGKPTTFIGNVADWEDYLEYRELVNDVAEAEAELDRGEYLTQAEAKRDALAERERIKRELGL